MNRFLKQHQLAATAVPTALVTLLLYWPILRFPLSFDDLLHIRLLEGMDYLTVWLPNSDFNFFRPVLFLPLLLTRSLFGYFPASFVYGQNLLLALLNGFLVVWLSWRLWGRWPRSLAAGLLFSSYPFTYQAVAVYGNNIYLILVFVILLTLHTYLLALDGKKRWWLVTAVLFVIGLLSHELMILFSLFAALVHWTYQGHIQIGNWTWQNKMWRSLLDFRALMRQSPFLIFLLFSILYFIVYQFLPLTGSPPSVGGNPLELRLLYFGQALVYPLAALGHQIEGLTTNQIIAFSLLLLIGLSLWTARKKENRLSLILGWGWWGSVSSLLTLTLPTDYILHGPRLNYLGSVGICLIWAVVLAELFAWRRWGRVSWTAVLLTILLFSGFFVRNRVHALANIGSPVSLITQVMAEQPLAKGVLLVNFPSTISPAQSVFPVGVEHVALMGYHLFAEEIVWDNLNQLRPVLAIGIPELLSDPGYPYGTHVQTEAPVSPQDWAPAGAHVFITEYTESGVQASYPGYFQPTPIEQTPLAYFDDYDLMAATAFFCNGILSTELTWEIKGDPDPSTSLFVQALAGDSRVVGQQDGPPLKIRPDLLPLPAGWQITDLRQLQIDSDIQPTQLLVGVYNYQTGERAPAYDANSRPLPANAYVLEFQNCQSG